MPLPAWIPSESRILVQAPRAGSWSGSDLASQVDAFASALEARGPERRRIGILADNSPDWVAVDLATQCTARTLIPLPAFFSPAQLAHVVQAARIEVLFCVDEQRAASLGFGAVISSVGSLRMFEPTADVPPSEDAWPRGRVQKITFTSGTTGAPRGVCLTTGQQLDAARALAEVTGALGITRHLALLPLPVLLENVAGVYAALLIGATCICPSLAELGLTGASGFDPDRCLSAISRYAPESVILLPQMLHALVARLAAAGDPRIRSLKFVAVGGARTPPSLIQRARELGLPVYEGYGLTECASVVALNVPGADKPGTVGRPLPQTTVRVAPDGEIEVSGRSFCGYLDMPGSPAEPWLKTGDLGSRDADGFISITGRKTNVLITSFGRNVSPEWPENLLLESGLIAQAAVFGEARAHLVAVLAAASRQVADDELEHIVAAANRRLPDYARIRAWVRAAEHFSPRNGLATSNGRVRRHAVWSCYANRFDEPRKSESYRP